MSFEVYPTASDLEPLRAILPVEGTDRFDPFLVVHEQGPVRYAPGRAIGFGDHPHRGFETVTYVIVGEQRHRDTRGHEGTIRAGGLQWMTAAGGIVHAELPTDRLLAEGGEMHAFQIWINLPRSKKLMPPRYQEFDAERLPVWTSPGAWVRLLAGSYQGMTAPVETVLPTTIAHVRLGAGGGAAFTLPADATTIVYAMRGAARLGPQPISARHVAIAKGSRPHLPIEASRDGFEALVLSASPIGEPVVSAGPFVMTSEPEIEEAYADYRLGRFGAAPLAGIPVHATKERN